ncbi:M20 family metallo-hydrolase [Cytobacillus depressus]|uniref:M20 family metallo-hydrolase n=1 Tax=Cytobacillus depressus TaxID=1602942 RepID=A0A6L3VD93_9BACI|nr:amidohydrolase [Cytobacillus depressus]KAB2338603.1 M20 family metallo-hydrolase [Cytobacillus depressus]
MMEVISLRREFHKHPELGFTEFWTASKVVEILESLNYKVLYGRDVIDEQSRRGVPTQNILDEAFSRASQHGANQTILERMTGGNTAVVGVLEGKRKGPTVAFRFDMDALPIQESTNAEHFPFSLGFNSKFNGNMHACAHDGHTAMGLALAERLANRDFCGTLKLIFQPAEEGGRGAYAMTQKGVVDDVDFIFCSHLGLDLPLGEVHGGNSTFLASSKLEVEFHGVPSHAGGTPEKGCNALLGAATALLNIHALPRFSGGITRVNVGILKGGTAANIIPQQASMVVEVRSDKADICDELLNRVYKIIKHSAEMHGLTYETKIIGGSTTIQPDPELVSIVLQEAKKINGFTTFKEDSDVSVGSEDASFFINRVQELGGKGTYMNIGSPLPAPHHHHEFDIDENVLPLAVNLLENIARRMLS